MASPGTTKTITLSNDWQRIAKIYNDQYETTIRQGGMVANGVWLQATTYDAEVAFSDSLPDGSVTQGHLIEAGGSHIFDNQVYITRGWIRNGTAGSNAILTITPLYE